MTKIETVPHAAAVVRVPGSKSYTQRALICAALAEGKSKLRNVLASDDTAYFIKGLRALGTSINNKKGGNLFVEGTGGRIAHPGKAVYLGNNGTALRFFTSLVALGTGRYELTGTARLCERPVGALLTALNTLGVKGYSKKHNGCPPVVIEAGGLPGGSVTMSDVESSQFVSSLLLSAPFALKDVTIRLEGSAVSRPYIAMTVQVMRAFGADVEEGGNVYFVKAGRPYQERDYLIEGDVSSASYFMLAAALMKRRIRILNLNHKSLQGDMKFIELIEKHGCAVTRGDEWIEVEGRQLAEGDMTFSMGDMPDMVPTLAVLAAFRKGQTVIKDAAHLRIKESDRLAALVNELKRIGITAEETADGMIITGGIPHGAAIETYNDHRIAMGFAVAGLVTPGIEIADRDCVGKSFPGFWDELKKL